MLVVEFCDGLFSHNILRKNAFSKPFGMATSICFARGVENPLPFMVSPCDFAESCRMLNPKTRKNPCQQWKNLSHRFSWFACRWNCHAFEKPEVFPCHTSCVYGVVASSNNHGHQMTALWLCLEIKWVKHWNDSWVCRCQKQIPWT